MITDVIVEGRAGMQSDPPTGQDPGHPNGADSGGIARIPMSNAVTAVIIAVAALAGAITVLIVMPGVLEALGSAVTITGLGFTLAGKIAIPK
ncbi:hypothetical protein ACIPSE_36370 [Streptomyces sp. NPDC090106]|uniref:hypothetical protein n=1 Tax=Streptomyces sp. NPDC090106 TaxID=3365946 RepID=UPI003828CC89